MICTYTDHYIIVHKDIFACLFSIHNTISLSCHEQVCLSWPRFERYFSHHPDDGRSISRNVAHLNILVHDMINLLYYIIALSTITKEKKKTDCRTPLPQIV